MLEQGMSSMTNMFGSSKALASGIQPQHENIITENDNFNPEDLRIMQHLLVIQLLRWMMMTTCMQVHLWTNSYEEETDSNNEQDYDPNICSSCGAGISDKVSTFSIRNHGRPLCMNCQKGGGY